MPLVRVGADDVYVREWGEPGAPAVLCWHALGPVASGATLGEVAAGIASRGRRIVALDGPGFGRSPLLPPERYEAGALGRLALGVADELGLDRFALLGHSWGGAVVLRAAALAPERVEAVVLLDSGHIDYAALADVDASRPVEEWLADARPAPRWPSADAFEAELRSEVGRFTPELLAGYLEGTRQEGEELVGVPPEAQAPAFWGLATARVPETWPALAGIPVLLLLATKPPHVDQNREHLPAFEQAVPQAEIRWVPDAGHDLPGDRGPELGVEIADWLASH